MSSVLVAIAVLVIGFVLAGYGVYDNVQASRRTSLATTIGAKITRLGIVNQDQSFDDGGRAMLAPSQESATGYDYYNQAALAREAFGPVTFRYNLNGNGYFVCATSTDVSATMQAAMTMVARDRPAAFVSGSCGDSSVAVGSSVIVSMKLY